MCAGNERRHQSFAELSEICPYVLTLLLVERSESGERRSLTPANCWWNPPHAATPIPHFLHFMRQKLDDSKGRV
jgi:hypothetical protein